jgi:methanogenic corrinoid protein MtbC1
MADWNDLPSQTAKTPDLAGCPVQSLDPLVPKPIWRARVAKKAASIAQSLHTLVLPQVGFALRSMSSSNSPASGDHGAPFEVQHFTFLALDSDETAAFAYVDSLTAQGTPTDLIFLNLLEPAARRLGEMWEDDTTSFLNVTLAVGRLQRILRHLGETVPEGRGPSGGTVLLTALPGEQHSFGLSMVAEFFRRDGWDIWTGPFASRRELLTLVQDRWFDLVGFSVGGERQLEELKRDIQDIRRDSRNRRLGIILGGPMMIRQPELAGTLGADLAATDGSVAPKLARELIAAMKSRT